MKTALTTFALVASAIAAPADGASINGTLIQQSIRSIRPVTNVQLTLLSDKRTRSARVFTDRNGEFWFYDVPRGRYVLEIWRGGLDDTKTRSLEACRLEVTGPDVALPKLRLHNSPMRLQPEIRNCSAGLEHLYVSG